MTPDPQDDLAYIRQVMEQTRRFTLVSGSYFIVWGLLIILGLVSTGITLQTAIHLPLSGIWIGLMSLGWVCTFWLSRRESRYEPIASYATYLITCIWTACGVAMTTAFMLGQWVGVIPGPATGGLSALFIGIGVFMTGVLSGMQWLRNLSFGWWAGAVVMFIWHGPVSIWISTGLLLGLLVVPGLVLNRQAQALHKSLQ
jgi:hypothetical protein